MKFLITSTPHLASEDPFWFPTLVTESYLRGDHRQHEIVDDPHLADALVFFEADQDSERKFSLRLRQHPLVKAFPNRCFTVNLSDRPIGYLPGLYASMPRSRMDFSRFRASGYMVPAFANLSRIAERCRRPREPRFLFSFVGGKTASVRQKILDERERLGHACYIKETRIGQNWSGGDQSLFRQGYCEVMLESRFVLCPRGYGTSTYRCYESMELGRAPVILSDEWVAPNGPDWDDFSLRIPESEWEEIPRILAERAQDWQEMGHAARENWERWFAPAVQPAHALDMVEDLLTTRTYDEGGLHDLWDQWTREAIDSGYFR